MYTNPSLSSVRRLATQIGSLIAHNDNQAIHMWLCHSHGDQCPDGCNASADRGRLAIYETVADQYDYSEVG